jgi:cation diffusion facilitator family transporter
LSDRGTACSACDKCVDSVGAVSVGGNLALATIKGFLGVLGGSQALVADAVHSFADLISSALLFVGLRVANRPADQRHPFGYGKIEFIVATGIYLLLLSAGGFIMYDSFDMIIHGEKVNPSFITVFGALLSVVGNELMYRHCACAGSRMNSPSMLANSVEKRADVYSSLAVLVGILGAKGGIHLLDPLAAVVVACLILHSSLKGLWEALQGLMDSSLPSELLERMESAVRQVPGVLNVSRLRSRELGQRIWVEIEILTDGNRTLDDVESLREEISRVAASCVDRFGEFVVHLRPGPAHGEVT